MKIHAWKYSKRIREIRKIKLRKDRFYVLQLRWRIPNSTHLEVLRSLYYRRIKDIKILHDGNVSIFIGKKWMICNSLNEFKDGYGNLINLNELKQAVILNKFKGVKEMLEINQE